MPCKRLTVAFLLVMFALMLVVEPSPVHGASSLVQQKMVHCKGVGSVYLCDSATLSVSFSNPVTSGNVAVVGVYVIHNPAIALTSISDSQGSSFTLAATSTTLSSVIAVYLYYAPLTSSGSDTITATFSSVPSGDTGYAYVYIYEVSGVTTTGVATGTGAGFGNSVSTSDTPFQDGAFLLGIIGNGQLTSTLGGTTPGSGFTLTPDNPYTELIGLSHAQYSTSGVSSPTTFPATLYDTQYWVEVGIALNPIREISLSPACGPPGTVVSLSGSGFGASEHDPTISSSPDGLISGATIAIVDGVVSGTFVVAAGAQGPYLVTLHTIGIGQSASADFNTNCPSVGGAPVGGVVEPVNTLAVLAPWLAIIGLVGCIGTVVVIRKKRHQ
jgi:hypothetical protein